MVYTTKEVAEKFRTTVDTIKRMLRRGDLHGFKVGNEWRITEEEVNRVMRGKE